jgi:hypothetical protein
MEKKSHAVTGRQFILISGIPGSRKTTFGRYLKEKHGFYFFETDPKPNWDKFTEELGLGVDNFVARWLNRHGNVCLEWGFDPCYLPYVLRFKKQGASLFWFTCDQHIARPNYLEAHSNDPNGVYLDIQLKKIKDARLPTPDFVTIETYIDGKPIPLEELTTKVLSKSGYVLPK